MRSTCAALPLGVDVGGEDVPATLVERRGERDPLPVGRPPRLEVHRAVREQASSMLPVGRIEQPELDGIVAVGGVHDPPAVGRPVGLVVVAWPVGELPRLAWCPRAGARASPASNTPARVPSGDHATLLGPARGCGMNISRIVVRVADLDLLQYRRALCREAARRRGRQGESERPTATASRRHPHCLTAVPSSR